MKPSFIHSRVLVIFTLLLSGGLSVSPAAVTDTWVGGTATAGLYDFSTTANWSYSSGSGPVAGGNMLGFGSAGSPSPTNDQAGFTFGGITFNSSAQAYTLVGNAFTLTGGITNNSSTAELINPAITLGGAITVTNNGVLTLGGIISGAYALTATGAGTLTLSNGTTAEAYTGATVVSGGTLALSFPNAATSGLYQSSSLTINNGATVLVNSDNALAGSAGTLGALPVTINAGGTLTGSSTPNSGAGASSHIRGVLTLAGGTLANGGTGKLGFGNWDLDDGVVVNGGTNASTISSLCVIPSQTGGTSFGVTNGGTAGGVDLIVTGTLINGTNLSDTGIILSGGGTMALLGTNTYTGATTISSGTLMIGGAGELGGGSYAGAITNNGAFNFDSSQAQTLSGPISGTGTLTQSGSNTLTLTGTNTYGGGTLVNGGILLLPAGGVVNGGAASVADNTGGQLVVSGGSLTATNSSNIGLGAGGLLVSGGTASFAGGLTTDLGSDSDYLIEVTGGALTADSLAMGRMSTYYTSQPTAGNPSAGLYISGGTVVITNNLDMSVSKHANSTVSARLDGGNLTVGGVLVIGMNIAVRWSVFDVNGGTLTVNDTTTGISVGGPYSGNAELLVRAGTATAGILTLGQSGVTNMTAAVNLTGGALYVGGGGIVQAATGVGFATAITLNGGILGATTNWSSSLPLTLGGAAIQAADAAGVAHAISLSGVLSGGGLIKTGAGQLTLSGANTYTNGTTVSAGTLSLGTGNVLPNTGAFTLNGGNFSSAGYSDTAGTLTLQSSSSITLGTNTAGTLTFAGGSYTAGTLTISNWSGTAGQTGAADRIFITNAPGATFLTNITFARYRAGAIRLGTGEIVPSGSLATNLAITSVNGGFSPTAGTPFSVVVQSQGLGGTAQNVTVDTAVTLSLNTGTGPLGGTLTGTISNGTSSLTFTGLTLTKAQSGVILTATRTSGLSLTAGNSSAFTVTAGAVTTAQSTVTAGPTTVAANDQSTATITVTLNDVYGNPVSGKTVTLAKNGGNSVISAASGASSVSGVVTFTVLDAVGETATYTATDATDGLVLPQTAGVTFTTMPWYNTAWRYRLTIQVNATNVAGTLTNFPVLINLTNSSLALSAQTNGYDLLFTAGDGTNKLAHELESYTSSNGLLIAWVGVPLLISAANTNLYLYFGNATATNQQNATAVWDANYKAVWHFQQTPTGSAGDLMDSTSNQNNGTSHSLAAGTQAPGQIGGSLTLNGTNAFISSALEFTNPTTLTLQAWVKTTSTAGEKVIGFENTQTGTNSASADRQIYFSTNGTAQFGTFNTSTNGVNLGTSSNAVNDGHWHFLVGYRNNALSQVGLYVDGVLQGTPAASSAIQNYPGWYRIGSFNVGSGWPGGGPDGYFAGSVDEIRVSHTNRSSAWIATEYNNESSPGTFYNLGTTESQPPSKLAVTLVNGGASPAYGTAFSVVVQAQDANGNAANAVTNTAVTLSVNTGTGALGGTLTGLITNGTSSVTLSGLTYSAAQSGIVLTATRTGGDSLTAGNSSAFTETPAPVTITAGVTANNKTYNGTTTATISSNNVSLSGVIAGDTANVALATNGYSAALATATVGTGMAVTVSGLSLTGSAAGNYTLTQPSLTANITAATVTLASGVTANNKTYDGTATATISSNNVSLSGVIAGDTANVALSTNGYSATFATAAVGAGKTVTVSGLSLTGTAAGNYTLTQPSLTANISVAAVTVVAGLTANNKTYNGATTATMSSNTVSLSGVVAGDTANVALSTNGYSATFTTAAVGTGKAVTVSGLSLTGTAAGNYTLTQPTGLSANITAAMVTIISGLTANNKVYDGTPAATISSNTVVLNGVAAGDTAGVALSTNGYTAAFTIAGVAGGIGVTVSGLTLTGGAAANYTLTQPAGLTAGITAKALNYTGLSAAGKVYDATTTAALSGTAAGLSAEAPGAGSSSDGKPYTGDTVGFATEMLTGTFAGAGVGTGTAVTVTGGVTLSGASSDNYTVGASATALTANITAKPLNYTGISAANKVYNATVTAALSGTAAGLSAEAPGAGSGSDGKPYTGDTVSFTTGTLTGTFNGAGVGAALAVTVTGGITLSGAQNSDYSVGTPSPALTANITAAPVAITSGVTANNKVYNGTPAATINSNSVVLSGVAAGDTAGVALSTNGYTATFASAAAANGVAVTVTGLTLTGSAATNYTLTQPTGLTANITSATVTITSGISANNKVYDGTPAATISSNNVVLSGVAAGDAAGIHLSTNGYTAAFASAAAANGVTVTVAGLTLTGGAATNYTLTQPTGLTANLTAAPVTITSGISANNKAYDGTTAATINSNNIVLSGVVAADTAGVHLSTNGYTAAFASAAAAGGVAVTVNGLTLTGGAAANYALTQPAGLTANITALTVTIASGVTANNKPYDGTTPATISSNNVVLGGVLAGDANNVRLCTNGYTAAFAMAGVGTGLAVSVGGLTLTGGAAGDYTLTQPALSANITAKTLTITGVTAANKIYDTTTNAVVSTNGAALAGVVGGDTITLGGIATGAFATKTVANGKAVTISGLTMGGASAGNYTLTQPATTANITAATLTVTGITANNKVYDGTTAATVNPGGASLLGVLSGDSVTLNTAGATGTFNTATPGTGKTVTAGGLTLGGADAGNYVLTPPTTTANITAALVIGSASGNLNWSAITNGSGPGGQPGVADTLTIDQGATLTVDVTNGVCAAIQVSVAGQGSGTLVFNTGSQVTVHGALTNGAAGAAGGTLGTVTMTSGGTLLCQGLTAFATPTPTVWTPGAGTVQLTATNSLPGAVFTNFNNLTLTAGATTLGMAVTVTNLTQSGGNLALGSNALTVIAAHLAGTNTVSGTGAYTNTGLLATAGPAGVAGNLTTSGTLNLAATAFLFDGAVAQVTSATLPATISSLTLSNAAGLTLSQGATTTNLTLAVGNLTTAGYALTVAGTNNAALSGGNSTSYIIGALQKTFGPGLNQAFTFPIGTAGAYTPVALAGLNLGGPGTGTITWQSTDGDEPQLSASGITPGQSVNRYWTLTQSGPAITNNTITFNYPAAVLDAGAYPGSFIAQIYTNSVWSSVPVVGAPTATATVITNYPAGSAIFALGDPVSDQTITFTSPGNQTYGVGPITLTATASSGLAVTYSAGGPAAVTNTTLYINGSGTVTVTASQAGNGTYGPATPVIVSLLVAPKTLAIASGITARNKVYDGTTTAALSSNNVAFTGLLAGDAGAVAVVTNGYAAAFAGAAVAGGVAVTVTGLTLTGGAATNYTLTQPAGLTAGITAAPLTVTANSTNRVYGAANPVFTAGYSGFVNGETAAVVSGTPGFSTTATSASPVNTYAITPSLGGLTAANYSFTTFVNGTLTITSAASSTAVAVSANPALLGSNITFTATVTAVPPGGGTPTGTVQWLLDGIALTVPIALSGGTATLTTSIQAEDTYTLSAAYGGDGNFTGSTNSLSPALEVLGAPVAGSNTLVRYPAATAKGRVTTLLAAGSDPDGDPLTLYSVNAVSAQGGAAATNAGWVLYTPPGGYTNTDSFTYVITDGSLLATGMVAVAIITDTNAAQNLESSQNLGNGSFLTSFFGIPGRTYTIQCTTNPAGPVWQSLGTATADATGRFQYTDNPGAGAPARTYRSIYP